jgi:hypothetical protein
MLYDLMTPANFLFPMTIHFIVTGAIIESIKRNTGGTDYGNHNQYLLYRQRRKCQEICRRNDVKGSR